MLDGRGRTLAFLSSYRYVISTLLTVLPPISRELEQSTHYWLRLAKYPTTSAPRLQLVCALAIGRSRLQRDNEAASVAAGRSPTGVSIRRRRACFGRLSGDRGRPGMPVVFPIGGITLVPGRHVTDHQMRLKIPSDQYDGRRGGDGVDPVRTVGTVAITITRSSTPRPRANGVVSSGGAGPEEM